MSSVDLQKTTAGVMQFNTAPPDTELPRGFMEFLLPLHRELTPRQQSLSRDRAAYWKFLIDAATRYRHAFDVAMTLAVMGYHFQTLTKIACETK